MTVHVLDVISVIFGPGFEVTQFMTAFESSWITLSGIPMATDRESLYRLLSPFGVVAHVNIPAKIHTGRTTTVSAHFTNYAEAVAAIDGLDNAEAFGSRIRVRSSLGRSAVKRHLQDRDIAISWTAPTNVGYVGFDTSQDAQNAIVAADGFTLRGHRVAVAMHAGLPAVAAYNIKLSGLPPDANPNDLAHFGWPKNNLMFERPTCRAGCFGIPRIKALLATFGKLEHFDVSPPPYTDGMVQARVRFGSPNAVEDVCTLHGTTFHPLGGTRLYVRRVLSILVSVAKTVYNILEPEVLRIQEAIQSRSRGSHLCILEMKPGMTDVDIELVAEDREELAYVKTKLSQVIRGRLVMENASTPAWDDYFSRPIGGRFLDTVQKRHAGLLIHADKPGRTIRILGLAEKGEPAVAEILAKLLDLRAQMVHTIHHHDHRDHCLVCLCPPAVPVTLYCGHTWCKACLSDYLRAANGLRSFPLRCFGGSCTECIPLEVARSILPLSDFDALALSSFQTYVQARPDEFHHCPTPDCPQVFRVGPRDTVLTCPSCFIRVCTHCKITYHEGVTCANRTHGAQEDRLFDHYVNTHDVKTCPGCRALIERAEGCHHVTCTRCKTHVCWVCLETFEEGKGIYEHLRSMHGSIGL
ncbi:hypothetical protein BV25DRAFT_1794809 [Artomyces pyxidatus]|uniref:Uncharacterized protein n=1 Tax=Artomyces pyxidatus TaxID=48021 RepID=A0ACB8TFX0_9AGAM|nr:hypothetical protein BV25DRAFT_1794809 [Artomyces pyxidatus]